MSLNRVVMCGRLVRDPELRRTGSGKAVTSFTLALNRNFNSGDGQQADYIPCVCWNKTAENVSQYCSKGALVGVDGRLQSRSYENNQGQKVYVIEVICDSVQFLETKKNDVSRDNQTFSRDLVENDPFTREFNSNENSFNLMPDDIQF